MNIQLFFNLDHYIFTLHALGVLLAGFIVFCFGLFILMRERSNVALRNWLFTLTESVWLLSFGMAYASRTDVMAFRWFLIGDMGVVFIPAALLAVNVSVARRERELRTWVRVSVGLSLVFFFLLLFTDTFIEGMHRYSWGPAPAYGIAGELFIIYAAVVGIFSLVLFYRAYKSSTHPRFRQRQRGFLICALIGYSAFLDFAAKLGIPLYPFGYLAIIAYIIYAALVVTRYSLVDITPELATNQILETMQGAVIVTDLEGVMRVVNRAAQEMLGFRKSDLLGKDLTLILPMMAEMGNRIRGGERAVSDDLVWPGGAGERYEVNVSGSLLTGDRDESPVGVVYVAHDITKRKQAEERLMRYSAELQEANKKLETLDKLKSELVTVVSHELRTPLTSIKANAELMLIKPQLPQESKLKLLNTINQESDRLSRLINDLLDLSRIEEGHASWRRDDISLHDVIQASVQSVLSLVQNKNLELSTELADALPTVAGDRDRLVQVMTNLLSNAVKFTPPGGVIRIGVRSEQQPRPLVVVSVSDTGPGIAAEDIGQIFDKFHRSRNESLSNTVGTGLGLSIARQIVEAHGGTIRAASTPGSGSTFTFTVPYSDRAKTAPVRS